MLQSLGHLTPAGCHISNYAKKTKKNILMIIFQNKKKIDFSTLFKKQFDKLLLFYKEDEKIVGKAHDSY